MSDVSRILRFDNNEADLAKPPRPVVVSDRFPPETKELWFTDNGRDWLGDDQPDCELNHAPRKDMHFG